jgi:hypothetical protein
VNKRVAIVQSNYIPWKGYFDLINSVDEFILFDDAQYTRRDWRNRNKIKTPQGSTWLTIPVAVKGKYLQRIRDTNVQGAGWAKNHWRTIVQFYSKAPHFLTYRDAFESLYLDCQECSLSQINYRFLSTICGILGISTKISRSMDYSLGEGGKTERLVSLCQQAGAQAYVSGPSARDYMQPELLREANLELQYFDYGCYPKYHQMYPPFVHDVSVVDLLLNEGPRAREFMKSFGPCS